jgi:thiamine biosynthesis lipoprotein
MLQTTVIAPTATETDALSTSMFVTGPENGQLLLNSMKGTSALWISGTVDNLSMKEWHWPARLRATKPDRSVDAKGNNAR